MGGEGGGGGGGGGRKGLDFTRLMCLLGVKVSGLHRSCRSCQSGWKVEVKIWPNFDRGAGLIKGVGSVGGTHTERFYHSSKNF